MSGGTQHHLIQPISCDTFVVLPSHADGCVIFGKNSDRPSSEAQEVVYYPASTYKDGDKVKCTLIEIEQASETHAVLLSKPSWMWGAEMGSNNFGVCIGNEAVWTKLNSDDDLVKRLLGMDLVRLGLERAKTAREAVDVITNMLDKYGQGGPCSNSPGLFDWSYHNSFLISDRKEAWVLEAPGKLWAAERITEGFRNISNSLSIGTKIDLCHPDLKSQALKLGLTKSVEDGEFNFSKVFSDSSPDYRFRNGSNLLREKSSSHKFGVNDMMTILRDEDSGICMGHCGTFVSASSQVSLVQAERSGASASAKLDCHWITGLPNPQIAAFKPFVFTDNPSIGNLTVSPLTKGETFSPSGGAGEKHPLYVAHELFRSSHDKKALEEITSNVRQLERESMIAMEETIAATEAVDGDVDGIFGKIAQLEYNFYKMAAN